MDLILVKHSYNLLNDLNPDHVLYDMLWVYVIKHMRRVIGDVKKQRAHLIAFGPTL